MWDCIYIEEFYIGVKLAGSRVCLMQVLSLATNTCTYTVSLKTLPSLSPAFAEPWRLFASVSVSKEHGTVSHPDKRTNTLGNLCKPELYCVLLAIYGKYWLARGSK